MRRSARPLSTLLLLLPLLACSGPGTELPAPSPPPAAESEAVQALVSLGDQALAEGDLDGAEDRFRRASEGAPSAASPRIGLARVALARGDAARAREHAEAALERAPEQPDALTLLAVTQRERSPDEARALLLRALASDRGHVAAHARLMELTGPAPRRPVADLADAQQLARRHPYDPWARLQAAQRLAAEGNVEAAVAHATEALWLVGEDPRSGAAAARLLAEIDPGWARRRIVPVHVFADDDVRADPDWPVRIRLLFRGASASLEEALGTAFVPRSLRAFSSARASDELRAISAAFRRASVAAPVRGIVAGLTERTPPRRPGSVRLGEATFLGRHLVVRLDAGETQSRPLLHELLHLYGGIHIAEPSDSILNPSGDSLVLDAANHRIVSLLRERRFGPGGLEANVFPFVDLADLTDAFEAALRMDLRARRLGVLEAQSALEASRYVAARKARDAAALDPHLADVSRLVARLLLEQERVADAVRMLELESRLRGAKSARGRAAAREAKALRRSLSDRAP